ncbi:MAG: WecB/TagA/CpsF family glycosyltransferase, partial [Chloroflexota bacterium]
HDWFREVLRNADLATADGIGVLLAGRLLNHPIRARVTGVDLVQGVAAIPTARIFLLGAAEGTAEDAAATLRDQGATAGIAGCFAGDPSGEGWPEIERHLQQARPTVLLVAFGHPKQDLWIDFHREHLESHGILVAIGVGGSFDYISGHVPRAPSPIRRFGLEWLYRLVRQPWRWRRQLALPVFVIRVLRERFRTRPVRRAR